MFPASLQATGICKRNNRQLAGAKRSFPSEAACYLLYADLGILRAKRCVIKLARSPRSVVQICEQDLNTFLCFYHAKQENGCEVNKASNFHAINVLKARSCVLACQCTRRERAFTSFPEIPWRVTIDKFQGSSYSILTGESPAHVLSHLHLDLKNHVKSLMCPGHTMHTFTFSSVHLNLVILYLRCSATVSLETYPLYSLINNCIWDAK